MDISHIINPLFAMSVTGLLCGLGLGYAGKKLEVKVDPRIAELREALPGANCAGCGFPGCDALAEALAEGRARPNACPVGGATVTKNIAKILGSGDINTEKHTAFVKCSGGASVASYRYSYEGILDCEAAMQLAGGGRKNCLYGCMGLGSCKHVCPFDAIKIENNIAVIDPDKCTSCGKCIKACPKKIIELVPEKSDVRVVCSSKDKGKTVKENCSVGCIGCKLCEKACRYDAVSVVDNIAKVDYSKCTKCLDCVKKCPSKVISGIVNIPQ